MFRNADGVSEIDISIPNFPLLKGHYQFSIHLLCERGIHLFETALSVCSIEVIQDGLEQGIVRIEQVWRNIKPGIDR